MLPIVLRRCRSLLIRVFLLLVHAPHLPRTRTAGAVGTRAQGRQALERRRGGGGGLDPGGGSEGGGVDPPP